MNDVEYVVPPGIKPQKSTGVSGGPGKNISPKPPKKPNQFLNWVKTHKGLAVAIVIVAGIFVLVGSVLVTKQKVSLFGLQLNPLYQQANCPIEDVNGNPVDCTGGGGTLNTLAIVGDFPEGYIGVPYAESLSVSGTSELCTWSLVSITPNITGAQMANDLGGQGTSGTFRATATAAGTYQVTVKVTCGTQQVTKTLQWIVMSGPNPAEPTIEGTFQTGTVNVPFSTNLSLEGNVTQPCTWQLVSSVPPIPGATVQINGTVSPTSSSDTVPDSTLLAYYHATPTEARTYQITIKATCQNNVSATNVFTWVVNPTHMPPVTGDLDITGTFPDGKGGEVYTTNVQTLNAAGKSCTFGKVTVEPAVNNPIITPVNTLIETDETMGTFSATAQTPGLYSVTIPVTCSSLTGIGPARTAQKIFKWRVNGFGPTPTELTISANFTEGKVGQEYSTNVSTVNGSANCTLTLKEVKPPITGAILAQKNNATGSILPSPEKSATFVATPKTAGEYLVTISAECPPLVGDGATKYVEKQFNWKVTDGGTTSTLAITGTFPDSKVNEAYTANIQTVNAQYGVCKFTLVEVKPPVVGATVTTTDNLRLGIMAQPETSGVFSAKPTTAGTYLVKISVSCDPKTGDGPSKYAEKEFNWKVSGTTTGGGGGGGGGGTTASTCTTSSYVDKLTAIYRWWSPSLSDHMYTTNANEKPNGYRYEGISGYVFNTQVSGTQPIYRSSKASIGAHYYGTTNDAAQYGYTPEGIIGYAFPSSVSGSSPWYRLHKGDPVNDYVQTTSEQERNSIAELGYSNDGTVAYLCGAAQTTELQPLFRLWGGADGDHFYTTNFAERDSLIAGGYRSEGVAGYIYGARRDGTAPLYRSYSRAIGDHLYTTSEAEARSTGYTFEGIMGYISTGSANNTAPLHRLYSASIGDHFYTASDAEAATARQMGYKSEGDTGFVYLSQ